MTLRQSSSLLVSFTCFAMAGCGGTTNEEIDRRTDADVDLPRDAGNPADAARDGQLSNKDADSVKDATSRDATWSGCSSDSDGDTSMAIADGSSDVFVSDREAGTGCNCSESSPCPLDCGVDVPTENCATGLWNLDEVPWTCPPSSPFDELNTGAVLYEPYVLVFSGTLRVPIAYAYDLCSGRLVGFVDFQSYPGLLCRGILPHSEPAPPENYCNACECDLSAAVARWRAGYMDVP
jgi:hypothetical protein